MGKGYVNTKTAKWHPLVPFLAPHSYHTKQLNPWPMNLSGNGKVNYSWLWTLSACSGKIGPFKDHPSTHGYHDNLQKWATAKGAWATSVPTPAWIVNVYNYHLIVKIVSSCCVHGRLALLKSSHIWWCTDTHNYCKTIQIPIL